MISRFRTPVIVERPRTAEDGAGHTDLSEDENWCVAGRSRAEIKSRGGRESVVFKEVRAETSHIVELRADPLTLRITPTWRLRIGCRKLNVTDVCNVNERGRVVRLQVVEAK